MKNVLMQVCRATHRYNERQIAAKLGMTPEEYIDLETGTTVMTPRQAEQLSDVYNIEREYFLESSQQLDLLLARANVILHHQAEIERLKKFVVVTKTLLHDSNAGNEITVNENAGYGQETAHQ
ncbi:hypothetical protein A3860_33835 [Niastella vici]|uniref:HTH cro/C1-type domain-containing protein n=1 Tax=Niastella vici TaxID=1703345 RepID=A0A1V9FPS1_9BACT|nr:helix-turn-helix transcriptional regulator [Niastella vici]OQP60363.1 hypothetical protein A3860_33835 [Niastella vici]